jgi:N4-gp56 family major capsid protein
LTDGTSPTGINSTSSNVIATAKPYGAWEQIASLYEMTTIDSGLKEHVEVMAQNAGESMDIVLGKELNASATTQCANTAQITATASTDTMSVTAIRTAVTTLKKNKAPKWENGNYRGVFNVDAIYQLQGDTAAGNWINIGLYNSEKNAEMLKKGVIGSLYGVDIVETNQAFSASATATDGVVAQTGRSNFIGGKGAVAEVKISGLGDARIIHKRSSDADTSNPLNMYSTLGWKVDAYAAKVLNADWVINVVSYGTGACN